jgi:hypothetical protein
MSEVESDILRLENKVDRISDDITEIKVIMERNTTSLEYHIQRTDLAERNIEMLRKEITPIKNRVEFEDRVAKGAYIILKFVGGILAAAVALKTLGFLFD